MNLIVTSLFLLEHARTLQKAHCIKSIDKRTLAHINSCKTALVLLFCSLMFHYFLLQYKYDISAYSEDPFIVVVADIVVYYFLSFLLFDLTAGTIFYKEHMGLLTGYIHHTVYVFVCLWSTYKQSNPFFCLFFIEELPTFVLNIGICNPKMRSNNLFGTTFFLTRIFLHVIMWNMFKHDMTFLIMGAVTFALHSYWFKNWLQKYVLTPKLKAN